MYRIEVVDNLSTTESKRVLPKKLYKHNIELDQYIGTSCPPVPITIDIGKKCVSKNGKK